MLALSSSAWRESVISGQDPAARCFSIIDSMPDCPSAAANELHVVYRTRTLLRDGPGALRTPSWWAPEHWSLSSPSADSYLFHPAQHE